MLKILTILLNSIVFGFLLYLFFEEGFPSVDEGIYIFFWVVLLLPLLNIYLFCRSVPDNDNLISLWFKVRKKKLKEELES